MVITLILIAVILQGLSVAMLWRALAKAEDRIYNLELATWKGRLDRVSPHPAAYGKP